MIWSARRQGGCHGWSATSFVYYGLWCECELVWRNATQKRLPVFDLFKRHRSQTSKLLQIFQLVWKVCTLTLTDTRSCCLHDADNIQERVFPLKILGGETVVFGVWASCQAMLLYGITDSSTNLRTHLWPRGARDGSTCSIFACSRIPCVFAKKASLAENKRPWLASNKLAGHDSQQNEMWTLIDQLWLGPSRVGSPQTKGGSGSTKSSRPQAELMGSQPARESVILLVVDCRAPHRGECKW